MKIGISGTRGIPNKYGGFEQFAQFVAVGLVKRGHEVTVYNSSSHPYQEDFFEGVRIVKCNDPEERFGTAGQFAYDFNCFRDARRRNFDVLLQLGYTSSSIFHKWWPRTGVNIVNMDGLEWKRTKYNRYTQRFLKFAERLAVKHADLLVADSLGIQDYLLRQYQASSVYIPYGADVFDDPNSELIAQTGLRPHDYFLIIARMEPENNIEMVIEGFLSSARSEQLVVVGNHKNGFGEYLKAKFPSERVNFIGAIYDQLLINNIRYFSKIYFHGHSVGGTNPSLLEAMACNANIIAHDNQFNRSILGDDARYFSRASDVAGILQNGDEERDVRIRKQHNLEKIKTLYNWEKIIDDYESVFLQSTRQGSNIKMNA